MLQRSFVLKNKLVLLLLSTLLISSSVLALEPYSGTIQRRQESVYLLLHGKKGRLIQAADAEISRSLLKLKNGDVISGLADFVNGNIIIQTIDYIGLKQLLGSWSSQSTLVLVPNFSEMKMIENLIHPTAKTRIADNMGPNSVQKYIYTVHPSAESGFHLFMSDDKQTLLADIEVNNSKLHMKIFDSETGELQSTFDFTKF